jgi:hypothetical protein
MSRRYTNVCIPIGIRENCHNGGRNLLLHLFMEEIMKVTVVITDFIQNFIQHSPLRVNSIHR